jgi:hypothetical protein
MLGRRPNAGVGDLRAEEEEEDEEAAAAAAVMADIEASCEARSSRSCDQYRKKQRQNQNAIV